MTLPSIRATEADVLKGAQAVFELRKRQVTDPAPEHRHPMTYKDYRWPDLPASEKVYYCDMAIAALNSFGVTCEPVTITEKQSA